MSKLICLDLDGTLLRSDKTISEETLYAIERVTKSGNYVTFATGRQNLVCKKMIEKSGIKVSGGLITSNGAHVSDINGETIFELILGCENLEKLLEIIKKYDLDGNFQSKDFVLSDIKNTAISSYIKRSTGGRFSFEYNLILSENFEIDVMKNKENLLKVIAIEDINKEKLLLAKEEIKKIDTMLVESSAPNNFEVMNTKANKGNAVRILSESLNIKREDVICVGDNENDRSMIEYAGIGVAMGNAIDSIKKIANYVTYNNDSEGITHVIDKFIFGK